MGLRTPLLILATLAGTLAAAKPPAAPPGQATSEAVETAIQATAPGSERGKAVSTAARASHDDRATGKRAIAKQRRAERKEGATTENTEHRRGVNADRTDGAEHRKRGTRGRASRDERGGDQAPAPVDSATTDRDPDDD